MDNLNLEQYHDKGYTGLENLGNTCFLNACLQILNHTYELNDIMTKKGKKGTTKAETCETVIYREWKALQELMWSNNGVVSPNRFVHHVQQIAAKKQREMFTGWAQNDMPEFLLFMIECLHISMARMVKMKITGPTKTKKDKIAVACYEMLGKVYEKEYSEIMDLFYAIYVSEIVSLDTKESKNMKPELYFILDLPIPLITSTPTLYDCFDLFTEPEILDGDNAWKNDATGQYENIQKRIVFWSFPEILVITLKRFCPLGQNKLKTLVSFPLTDLNLSKYVCGYQANKCIYELFGVCNHHGGVQGGHYTSFVLNSKKEWILYDDNQCKMVSSEVVVSPAAYCLFYRRKPNDASTTFSASSPHASSPLVM